MENYIILGTIGEGTYGIVLKCKHKETGQIVAIKKFKESDEDEQVRKTALREVRILKQLKHENIVTLIEVFRRKGKLYLVFEFAKRTILEELEKHPEGLHPLTVKKLMWQLVRSIQFCHSQNIIHRDVKPENLLVSKNGILKLCDFGFARALAVPGAKYTDYISTRWYRAPELLVGDISYGKPVDIWAMGCMYAEIINGLPLFPGESDIDQLFHITKCMGKLNRKHLEIFRKNPLYIGIGLPEITEIETLRSKFPNLPNPAFSLLESMLRYDPLERASCSDLLRHEFFENFAETFEEEFREALLRDGGEYQMKKKKNKKANTNTEEINNKNRKKNIESCYSNAQEKEKLNSRIQEKKREKKESNERKKDFKEHLDDKINDSKRLEREVINDFLPIETTRKHTPDYLRQLPTITSTISKPDRLLALPTMSSIDYDNEENTLNCRNLNERSNEDFSSSYNLRLKENTKQQEIKEFSTTKEKEKKMLIFSKTIASPYAQKITNYSNNRQLNINNSSNMMKQGYQQSSSNSSSSSSNSSGCKSSLQHCLPTFNKHNEQNNKQILVKKSSTANNSNIMTTTNTTFNYKNTTTLPIADNRNNTQLKE